MWNMKRFPIIVAAAAALLALASCDRYEEGRPPKDVRAEFERMYPDAFDVEWEWDGSYWEVSFERGKRPDTTEHKAWYDKGGKWVMTSTDVPLSSVPQKIIAYLAADPVYGTAPVIDDDAEFIETPQGDFYRFELSMTGRKVKVDVNINGEVKFAGYDF